MKVSIKNIVITGDSLSYNRYGYDPIPRENAWDCIPYMGSWSFRLRDLLTERGNNVALTGKGSTTASFLVENFEERIGKFSPDIVVLTTGANDRARISVDEYADSLNQLFTKINNIGCKKIIALSPPDSSNPADGNKDSLPGYISTKNSQAYSLALKECCDKYNAQYFDTVSLFKDIPVEIWRFDNVHFTPYGNDLLYHTITPLVLSQLR